MISPAYLAGLFDGEGHVQIKWSSGASPNALLVALQLTNTHIPVIQAVHDEWGGRLYTTDTTGRWKVHRLRWTGEQADHVAAAIIPFTIVKVDQLRLFIEARKLVHRHGGNGFAITPQMRVMRQDVIDRLQLSRLQGLESV